MNEGKINVESQSESKSQLDSQFPFFFNEGDTSISASYQQYSGQLMGYGGKRLFKDWGTLHPNPKDAQRARWSDAELNYLDDFERNAPKFEQYRKQLTSHCLQQIRNDETAVEIFHERHVLSSDRLSTGFDALMRKRKLFDI
jgi:hypothetical protein